jgi:hypothetical protein
MGIAYIVENLPDIFQGGTLKKIIPVMIYAVCVVDFLWFAGSKQYIWNGQQLSASLEYVETHKMEDDFIYVENFSIPHYSFLTGYDTYFSYFPIEKNEIRENIIFGARMNEITGAKYMYTVIQDTFDASVADITGHDRVWILFAHEIPDKEGENVLSMLLKELSGYGTVTLKNEYYGTPVYLFVRN